MKKLWWILILFFLPFLAEATHQVSGYIILKSFGGTKYQATIVDYTNICQTDADRDTLRLWWGDGTSEVLYRSNGPIDPNGYPGGEVMSNECPCRKKNIYISGIHTYPGSSTYHLWFDDQDRMANIVNIANGNSVNIDFFLFHSLTISPIAPKPANSPIIANDLTCVYACTGECFYYNIGAYSPDGDSLAYSLGPCLVYPPPGFPAPNYFIPAGATIDPATGTLQWCSPTTPGIYNFSIRITTYEKSSYRGIPFVVAVDTTEAELEIIVSNACLVVPPTLTGPNDTCVVAGTNLTLNYTTNDPDGYPTTLTATGEPFSLSPPAIFSVLFPGGGTPTNSATFNWQTNCPEVRQAPYTIVVTASNPPPPEDPRTNPVVLNAYKTTNITVVGPAPPFLWVTAKGNADSLKWGRSPCPEATGYNIYRHQGCSNWQHGPCETGVPAATGYVLIGSTSGLLDTTFFDNNGGKGLVPGIYYSYIVVATYPLPDGSLSYASKDTCILIKRDAPLITNVSVETTNASNGTIYIRWTKPLPGTLGIDTTAYPPPYKYVLRRATGMISTAFKIIDSVYAKHFYSLIDTAFIDNNTVLGPLNTLNNSYNYRVDLYADSGKLFVGSSATASSIYLNARGSQNCAKLVWASSVPWNDSIYTIFRKFPGKPSFTKIVSVPGTVHSYTDTNLSNDTTYCYYVESTSSYNDTTIMSPLYDSSEVQCVTPRDSIPPCAPNLKVSALCNAFQDSLIWDDPDHFCKNTHDVLYYNIYYAATEGGEMQIIKTIHNPLDTLFVNDSLSSVAGCYAVTAVDSAGNESAIIPFCVDNCPQYQLPNVFTPNGDGINDFFTPILPYRYIKSIDINIYNRWGELVFHTTNPAINWNGNDMHSGSPCPDGVYYYVCTVNEIRVTGIEPINLHGFVQIIRK